MKYKRKRTKVSKCISQKERAASSKGKALKKQVIASIILAFVILSLTSLGIVKKPVIRSVLGYVSRFSDPFSPRGLEESRFLKSMGEHIYNFCFGYLKQSDNPKTSVLAVTDTPINNKKPEEKSETGEARANSDLSIISDGIYPQKQEDTTKFEPIWPCKGEVSSEFGERIHPVSGESKFHNGIDIAANTGDEIFACEDGTIETATFNEYSGNYVVITHHGGYSSSYSHMSQLFVSEGMSVEKGYVIGLAGSTGVATGPHLHFEIKYGGLCKNPKDFITE